MYSSVTYLIWYTCGGLSYERRTGIDIRGRVGSPVWLFWLRSPQYWSVCVANIGTVTELRLGRYGTVHCTNCLMFCQRSWEWLYIGQEKVKFRYILRDRMCTAVNLGLAVTALLLLLLYLLIAVGLTSDGNSIEHIYTKSVHRTTQWTKYIEQNIPNK